MQVKIYVPATKHPLISEFWEMKFTGTGNPTTQMVPPFGKPELIFYLGTSYQIKQTSAKQSLIKGQYTLMQAITLKKNAHLFGIRLHPYALYNLVGGDLSGITNRVLEGKQFEFTKTISKWLQLTDSIDEMLLSKVSHELLACARFKPFPLTLKFLDSLDQSGLSKVTDIAQRAKINMRSLQRNFSREVGLTPKQYIRLVRVNQIEKMLQNTSDWIEVLTHFNLADQSHLIREVRSFRQSPPSEMVNKRKFLHLQLPPPQVIQVQLNM